MPRDTRTYITVHDGMPEHPKIESLSDAAFRALVEAWALCSRTRSDGFIKVAIWEKRWSPEARSELLEGPEPLAYVRDGRIEMHDYLEHQRSAEEIDEQRARNATNGAKGGKAKAENLAKAKQLASKSPSIPVATGQPLATESVSDSSSDSSSENVAVSVSVPLSESDEVQHTRATGVATEPEKVRVSKKVTDAAFDAFWQAYPRKTGKDGAQRRFALLLRRGVDPAELIAGAAAYAKTRQGEDPQFTPHPARWLNEGRWQDEVDAPRSTTPVAHDNGWMG